MGQWSIHERYGYYDANATCNCVFDERWLDDGDGSSPHDGRNGAGIWSVATPRLRAHARNSPGRASRGFLVQWVLTTLAGRDCQLPYEGLDDSRNGV